MMHNSLFRTDKEIIDINKKYFKMIYRICFTYLKNETDTEDAVQNTFLKFLCSRPKICNGNHEKAWFIVTASNVCKDFLRKTGRIEEPLEKYENTLKTIPFEIDETIKEVMRLPDKYKTVVYMYYYEGYNSREIAEILGKPKSTIRNYLREARNILKEVL